VQFTWSQHFQSTCLRRGAPRRKCIVVARHTHWWHGIRDACGSRDSDNAPGVFLTIQDFQPKYVETDSLWRRVKNACVTGASRPRKRKLLLALLKASSVSCQSNVLLMPVRRKHAAASPEAFCVIGDTCLTSSPVLVSVSVSLGVSATSHLFVTLRTHVLMPTITESTVDFPVGQGLGS
jgi:hypothetical protein